MAFLTCEVDPRTMRVLERLSVIKGKSIKQVAEEALESFAVEKLGAPPGSEMHFPDSILRGGGDAINLGGATVYISHDDDDVSRFHPSPFRPFR